MMCWIYVIELCIGILIIFSFLRFMALKNRVKLI